MRAFPAYTTTSEVLDGQDLAGKRFLITGVSAGLGVETARALAAQGAEIVAAARDLDKAAAATGALPQEIGHRIMLTDLDLASLDSTRACASRLLEDARPFDAIIANAGIMAPPFARTADGFESQIGVNHLGHFVLVNRLAPLLRESARVIALSSMGHHFSNVDLDDINYERRDYDATDAYGASKTANALFAIEFDRRHRGRGVRAAAVHPGGIATELSRYLSPEVGQRMYRLMLAETGGEMHPSMRKTVQQGAATTVWAAVTAPADHVGGRYCEDCHVAEVTEAGIEGVRAYAVDPDRARLLWEKSEALVGERFD